MWVFAESVLSEDKLIQSTDLLSSKSACGYEDEVLVSFWSAGE